MKDKDTYSLKVLDIQYKLIKNLKKKRIENNLSQTDIANMTGLSQQAISRIETFQYSPSLPSLIKYMDAVKIDINELF